MRVLTYARIRPALGREIDGRKKLHRCIAQQPGAPVLHVASKPSTQPVIVEADGSSNNSDARSFELDGVFDERAQTRDVYACAGDVLVRSVLSGTNATMLCYGMTSSGKSYTMLGEKGKAEGLVGLAAEQLMAAAAASHGTITVECAFLQVYGTVATDLLVADPAPLRIARRQGEVVIDGQSRRPVATAADVAKLVAEGITRRKVASQRLNSASSRSHAVLTFFVTTTATTMEENDGGSGNGTSTCAGCGAAGGDEDDMVVVRVAKLVCVDLAGSERVKESGVEGTALKEARAINQSLFHLVRVVQILNERCADGAAPVHVPYSDSPLTLLLSDALGGHCRTALIAALSPAQEHASQTCSTCSFAAACRNVQNRSGRVAARRVPRNRPWSGQDASAEAMQRKKLEARAARAAAQTLPWAHVHPGDVDRCPGGRIELGGVSCLVYGDQAAADRGLALVLHGNPSDAQAMSWLAPALVHSGHLAVCIDMPGFGESTPPGGAGSRMRTRSEHTCEPGGAADVVVAVLDALNARSCCLIGYDWGGGIALAMGCASKFKRRVHSIIAMHPAFSERVHDELNAVQAATMIMWAQDNAFHSWPKFRPLAAKLRERLCAARKYSEHIVKREADHGWTEAERSRAIVRFLTGTDPLPNAQTMAACPEREAMAADGSNIVRCDGIVFRDEVVESNLRADGQRDESMAAAAKACATLAALELQGELRGRLRDLSRPGGAAHASAMAEFARALPPLSEATLTPAYLEALGLWSADAREAAEALQARAAASPRYFCGRMVLLPDGKGSASTFASLVAIDDAADRALVRMADTGVELGATWTALLRANQRHVLPTSAANDNGGGGPVMRLEDSMWADFGSPLLRAEMALVALSLESVFSDDISRALAANDDDALDRARAAAVRIMRSCLDVTSFAREGGQSRGRDRDRYAKDDVAKMAAHGEGHCRTCSSCLAPFLWSFAELLAIDVHYMMDAPGSHQWLQYDTRPSMHTFVCDVYRDENASQCGQPRGQLLAQPSELTYGIDLFPRDQPIELGGRQVLSAALEAGDVSVQLSDLQSVSLKSERP